MEELITKLIQNPMFYFSLGSKELFHSNFWEWLSKVKPKETAKLFLVDIKDEGKEPRFDREKKLKNGVVADFYIEYGDEVFVIENKIKDYPYAQQLFKEAEYQIDGKRVSFVLVTLIEYPCKVEGFKHITYKELAASIVPEKFSDDKKTRAYIRDYVEMISTISQIIPQDTPIMYDFAVAYDTYGYLTRIYFGEVYQKYRASHLCQWIRDRDSDCKEIVSNDTFKHVDYYCDYSLFNKSATINIFKKIKINADKYIWAGVQIQNTQFRVMIHGDSVKTINAENFCDNLWTKLGLTKEQGRNKLGYCQFGETCKYRHREITRDISYEQLYEEINSVLIEAKNIENLLI